MVGKIMLPLNSHTLAGNQAETRLLELFGNLELLSHLPRCHYKLCGEYFVDNMDENTLFFNYMNPLYIVIYDIQLQWGHLTYFCQNLICFAVVFFLQMDEEKTTLHPLTTF